MPRRPTPAGPLAGRDSRRLFVDSSAWLAFFSARDQNHVAAVGLVRRAIEEKRTLITTNLILAEVHRLVLHRVGIAAALSVLRSVEASTHVQLIFPGLAHHEAARQWLTKLSDQVITYTDAASFAVMDLDRCRAAISFDHDFELAGFPLWRS